MKQTLWILFIFLNLCLISQKSYSQNNTVEENSFDVFIESLQRDFALPISEETLKILNSFKKEFTENSKTNPFPKNSIINNAYETTEKTLTYSDNLYSETEKGLDSVNSSKNYIENKTLQKNQDSWILATKTFLKQYCSQTDLDCSFLENIP